MGVNEFGELEAFLTLAEELHFGNTARRLHLSPGRVSQLIQALERRVQVRLVERSSRSVRLTEEGRYLLSRTAPAFQEVRSAIEATRSIGRRVRIGFLGPYAALLHTTVEAFRRLHPDVNLTWTEVFWNDRYGPLRRHEIDLLITPCPVAEPDLTLGPIIARYTRMVVVSTTHPLANSSALRLEDLADHLLIALPSEMPGELAEALLPSTTPSGQTIQRGRPANTPQEKLSMVAEGPEILLTSTSLTDHYRHPGVVYLPVEDLPPIPVGLVWRTDTPGSLLPGFADTLRPTPA